MKLEPGTKLNKKNSDDDVICIVIVTFAKYCWFEAIPKLDPKARSKIQRIPGSESNEFRTQGLQSLDSH